MLSFSYLDTLGLYSNGPIQPKGSGAVVSGLLVWEQVGEADEPGFIRRLD